MDFIIEALHAAMPVLLILTGLAIIFKFILVMYNKGFDLPAVFISFFKIYSKSQRSTSSERRKNYMRYNNFINYYLYIFIVLFIVVLISYQGAMFDF